MHITTSGRQIAASIELRAQTLENGTTVQPLVQPPVQPPVQPLVPSPVTALATPPVPAPVPRRTTAPVAVAAGTPPQADLFRSIGERLGVVGKQCQAHN